MVPETENFSSQVIVMTTYLAYQRVGWQWRIHSLCPR